jgi:hypothetical protein
VWCTLYNLYHSRDVWTIIRLSRLLCTYCIVVYIMVYIQFIYIYSTEALSRQYIALLIVISYIRDTDISNIRLVSRKYDLYIVYTTYISYIRLDVISYIRHISRKYDFMSYIRRHGTSCRIYDFMSYIRLDGISYIWLISRKYDIRTVQHNMSLNGRHLE